MKAKENIEKIHQLLIKNQMWEKFWAAVATSCFPWFDYEILVKRPEAVYTQTKSMLVAEATLATAKRKTVRKPNTRERQSIPGWL